MTRPQVTLRGLIIGTSHAAALRLAWNAWRADWPAMSLDFAALQGSVGDLMVQNGAVLPKDADARDRLQTTSGKTRFALADYGFVAVCGGVPGAFSGIRLYSQARCCGLPSVASGKATPPAISLLSTACFAAALTAMIRDGAACSLLTALREAAALPLYAVAEPMLSFAALADKTRFHGFRTLRRNGDAGALSTMLETAGRTAFAGVAHYIAPPAAARQNGYFTKPDLRRGATRLGAADHIPQPDSDFLHGNADYGRHILTALHAALPQSGPLS